MSTTTLATPMGVNGAGIHTRPGLGRLVAVELRKMVDTRAGFWLQVAMGVLTALAIAFSIAGLTPNPQTANIVSGTLAWPLFTLTGAVLPVEAMPGVLPDIVPYAVPYASLIEAIRGIALTGASVTAYGGQVLVGALWLAFTFALAAKAYRFDRE